MQTQRGLKKDTLHKRFVLGAHPIIEHFIEKLQIREIIGTYVPSDKRQRLDDGNVLSLLIHNILTTPHALYELQDWVRPLDAERVGLTTRDVNHIQDDRVGKCLAKFYDSRHKDVFFHLALRAIKTFQLECRYIHHDTTTITFAGRYPGWNAQEILTHGHNKDHRPDLKQLVLGLSVTNDGAVPINHRIYSGSKTDDRVHTANHKALQKLLGKVDFVYVADCKLATEANLQKISAWGGQFVSVMPRTWKADAEFRQQVESGKITWTHILSRKNNRRPESKKDRYYLAVGDYETHGYRLHWIRSTQKAEQDAETRSRWLERALAELQSLQARLNTYRLKERDEIDKRVQRILKKSQCADFIRYEIQATREYKRNYKKKGRPGKNAEHEISWKNVYGLLFTVDHAALEKAAANDGIFPLITNLSPTTHSAKKVLEIYKFQPFLEKRYTQLKTYQDIAPVYLKNPKRVVAFLHVHVMALMVSTLIERTLRKAMKKEGIKSLPIYPEGRPCPSPTIFDIARLFQHTERYEVTIGDETTVFPAELTDLQKDVLQLLDVPMAAYQ
jgi:transposase